MLQVTNLWWWSSDQWDSERCRSGNSSHASSKATSGAFVARQFVWFENCCPYALQLFCSMHVYTKVSPLKFLQLAGVPLLLLDALFCSCLSDDWFIVHSRFSVIECKKSQARNVCFGSRRLQIDPVHRINTSVLDLR